MPMQVFQYGSNTSVTRLNSEERLQGAARVLGLARTEACFDLVFAHFSPANGCAAAHLQAGGNHPVYGVLYEIPDERVLRPAPGRWRTLDDIENEGQAYFRTTIRVRLMSDAAQIREAITYLVMDPQPDQKTNISYVSHILTGLREQGAPPDYLAYVTRQAILSNPDIAGKLQDLS